MPNYRQEIYRRYLSNFFGASHNYSNIENDFARHYRYFKKNFSAILPDSKNAKLLDAGCGLGHFLNYCEREGYNNVIGLDVSAEAALFCQKRGWRVEEGELADYLKLHQDQFDCIIMNDIVEHLYKQELFDILLLARGALTKNGRLIIKTPNMANPFLGSAGRYVDFTHEIGFTESSIREVLSAAGFSPTKVFGSDIYTQSFAPLNWLAKAAAKIFSSLLYLINCLYGRTSLKIFEKNIIVFADRNR